MKSFSLLILRQLIVAGLVVGGQFSYAAEIAWKHPGGIIAPDTIAGVREKIGKHPPLRKVYEQRKAGLDAWMKVSSERLRQVFPRKRGNVYHNFSCPQDRVQLKFDPFTPDRFTCPSCGKSFDPATDSGVYTSADHYHGTMYDGWINLFFLEAGEIARDLGIVGLVENDPRYLARGIEILMLHAEFLPGIETFKDKYPVHNTILTYSREGDGAVLYSLACAYEVLREPPKALKEDRQDAGPTRGGMTTEQRAGFERAVVRRILDEVILEPTYEFDNNNTYQWHRCIVQCGVALERADLIDWSLGFGPFDPQSKPKHMSLRRLATAHFKPDGAFWEMCSGYHLYPVMPFCELAVMGHNLAAMDPVRFVPERYDMTRPDNAVGVTIRNALTWFMSISPPDHIMPTLGDSMASKAGMTDYWATAEIGYRWFGMPEIGDDEGLRAGRRNWWALLYGADEIVQRPTPFTSSYLSSGYVALRNEWKGNRTWVGLNALIPGGGHQHADRLGLLTYSHGKLLAVEKSTPYNEATTRDMGTFSYSHNIVTVDKTSQPQGESLKGEQVPRVTHFAALPTVKFAQLNGDRVYGQTQRYRRSVAMIEDVVVDYFDVRGGKVHDWMVHHAGTAPQLSVAVEDRNTFEPAGWIYNGSGRVRRGDGGKAWSAQWKVDHQVTSRLSMRGSGVTEVFALETYPLDSAVINKEHPACQTLCVRRQNDEPFVAVWDSWEAAPSVKAVTWGDVPGTVKVETAGCSYWMKFGPGEGRFDDGVRLVSDGEFAMVAGERSAVMMAGTHLEYRSADHSLTIASDKSATIAAEYADGTVKLEISGDIQYDTYGGLDHYREASKVDVKVGGDLWRIQSIRRAGPTSGR